ncbi:divalent metal cation transporter [Microbacterium azadirachtae]|uniref:divalent metal cation transporter n=1 Tax=Microbacterium azadirachtae TaxID=582680 RepID=UPI0021D51AC2|nr:divalent metal cation transporter [Microbacterium azadirachtae]UXW84612.1 divalent metal cation transporter [Microbacterium azadirachtae]
MAVIDPTAGSEPELTPPREDGPEADQQSKRNPVIRFLRVLGPGLVTGAADDDPSGVATYSQAGATFGNGLLWTVPLSLPLMMAVQEICDRMTPGDRRQSRTADPPQVPS